MSFRWLVLRTPSASIECKRIDENGLHSTTTGNAGPSKGGQMQKLSKVVFIAIATPNGVVVEEFNFGQPLKSDKEWGFV
jgi:nicotinamide-nucleotide amidase